MDPTQLQPGYRLDRYELLCPLAYGGMASVWLARFGGRLGFERMVVIKMILPQFSQDPRFQEMFLDEARIASRIEHSNVARILDVGEHQENYYIVMEWVDGDSLSKVLRASEARKQPVPIGVALRICADAAAGLHAAHELRDRDGTHLGVVHRDVSPQNILIANSGATMIIDFGVAKARDRVSQDTSAGQLKGKIRYMAPEQALGRSIDHRADVWALGAMLYELFTGNPPYDGPNEVATLHKLTSGQSPAPMPHHLPEVLGAVVDRALAWDPDRRFTTALELNLALEGAMVEINEPTTAAIVAHYTGQILADRKAARKRAVDGALDAARRRETSGANPSLAMPLAPVSMGSLPKASVHTRDKPTLPVFPEAQLGQPGPEAEHPSAASSGTMGASSLEYALQDFAAVSPAQKRKRYVIAAALGMSVAAGVIGVILLVGSAVKSEDPKAKLQGGPASRSVVTAPPSSEVEAVAPAAPPPPPAPAVSSAAPVEAPQPSASVAHLEPPSGAGSKQLPTPPVHVRPPPPPPPPIRRPPAPPPPPPPPATRPDRGF